MTATPTPKRLVRLALATVVGATVFAGAASGRPQAVTFVAGPSRVVQGNPVTVSVTVSPAGARCSLSVRYKSGARQKGLKSTTAAGGTATWTWTVPRRVQPGVTHVSASCSGAGRATRTMTVIGGVVPPKINVVQSGWSTRVYPYGGTGVSWGVILENTSKTQDAKQVQVLCNFVMSDNRLIGSMTVNVSDIAAGTKHATGGELTFPSGAPIARLEIVVKIGQAAPATRSKPGISFVRLEPSTIEPGYTGSIEGEVQNDSPRKTIQFVELSGVVFDSGGNIIGGATGFEAAALPPAARLFMKITNGVRPILFSKAASAMVSVVPTYMVSP
ncbi:MAG TPA: hypothetical protein VIR59_13220 [Gaiellaceae bacterium]